MDRVAAAPQSLTTRVLDAVEAGRVEILLQPIVGLEDRSVVSYEAFPRLKDEDGEYLDVVDDDEQLLTLGKLFEKHMEGRYEIQQ